MLVFEDAIVISLRPSPFHLQCGSEAGLFLFSLQL